MLRNSQLSTSDLSSEDDSLGSSSNKKISSQDHDLPTNTKIHYKLKPRKKIAVGSSLMRSVKRTPLSVTLKSFPSQGEKVEFALVVVTFEGNGQIKQAIQPAIITNLTERLALTPIQLWKPLEGDQVEWQQNSNSKLTITLSESSLQKIETSREEADPALILKIASESLAKSIQIALNYFNKNDSKFQKRYRAFNYEFHFNPNVSDAVFNICDLAKDMLNEENETFCLPFWRKKNNSVKIINPSDEFVDKLANIANIGLNEAFEMQCYVKSLLSKATLKIPSPTLIDRRLA